MWLKTLAIRNFRSIENLPLTLDRRANVIVGPNAIGKTTLLEAIRLTKAALAPRAANEAQLVFIGLGAISPHNPSNMNYSALARDITRPIEIDAEFELTESEVLGIDSLAPEIATATIRASMGAGAVAQGPLSLIQYLSSPQGAAHLFAARGAIDAALLSVKAKSRIALKLRINPEIGTISGVNQIDQLIFAAMEARLPPHQTLFSYFPADRAMPAGEINIQIGGPDTAAQLGTHNAQPQTKYHRLKPTIINNFLLNATTREKLTKTFSDIFSGILKDRALVGVSVSDIGLVSIGVREAITNRVFDIDGMSVIAHPPPRQNPP
jgi:hypothetical protein